jgi:hypothetical protein
MKNYLWSESFAQLYSRCLTLFQKGNSDFSSYYTEADLAFLRAIGHKPREFYDYVEDHGPDFPASTALLVAAVRRDYFLNVQAGVQSTFEIRPQDLPGRDTTLEGIPWLPRILTKARAKLRGELDPDIMYGCGGDRLFLSERDLHPADFLRMVWAAGENDAALALAVLARK